MSEDIVENVMEYCRANNRICPMPQQWNELWEILPGSRRVISGLRPPLPLILGSWYYSTPDMKMKRFAEHMQWAVNHQAIVPVTGYIYGLAEENWLHFGEKLSKV
jgi:hypothetical protein